MTKTHVRRSFVLSPFAFPSLAARKAKANKTEALPEVAVSAPIQREVTGMDVFTGRFEARESVEIRPRVRGYI